MLEDLQERYDRANPKQKAEMNRWVGKVLDNIHNRK